MFGLTAKEKAKKQYEEDQRRKTRNSNFTCSTNDSNFLLWYAAMNSGSDSCTTSSTVDHSPSYSSSSHSCSSSSSYDSGSSYSDSSSSSSSSYDSGSSYSDSSSSSCD
jgi:hypothetical protein